MGGGKAYRFPSFLILYFLLVVKDVSSEFIAPDTMLPAAAILPSELLNLLEPETQIVPFSCKWYWSYHRNNKYTSLHSIAPSLFSL